MRLQGSLAQAQEAAQNALASTSESDSTALELNLEMARILDRIGLHQNTRPVMAAGAYIEAAERIAQTAGPKALGAVAMAWAEYHYRAEMAQRVFSLAARHAQEALEIFGELKDRHGQADAVHLLGLIAMQKSDLDEARDLFDRSLELDRQGGSRTLFLGDYERHVGFLYVLEDNPDSAIPHFEASLNARREAGAIDASMFAAIALARTLVDIGRVDEAVPNLLYANLVAARIDSPVGKARAGLVLGRLYWQQGARAAARLAFEEALSAAESVGYTSVADSAREAMQRLD